MNSKNYKALLLSLLSLSGLCFAEIEADYLGRFYSRGNFDIYRDSKSEQLIEWRNKLFIESNIKIDNTSRLTLSLLGEYDIFWSEEKTLYRFFPELYEAYCKFNLGNFDITIGKINVSWGKADLSVNDVLTPFDIRELTTLEEEFLKIPIPMLRAQYFFGSYSMEGVLIPFYTPVRFDRIGTDWALFSPTLLSTFNPTYKQAIENGMNPGVSDLPDPNPINSEVGLRFTGIAKNLDYSGYYFYTWEDVTALFFNPDFINYLNSTQPGLSLREKLETINLLEVASYYPLFTERAVRESILGGDFSTTIFDIALRGEASLRYRFPFMDENLNVRLKTMILWDIGGDYMLPYDIYINMEFLQLYIPNYEKDLLVVKRTINLLSLLLRHNFMSDKASLEIRSLYNFTLKDFALNLLGFYQLNDNWRIGAGLEHLDGPAEESIFGFFKKNKNLLFQLKYSF